MKKIDERVKKFNGAEWRHKHMTFGEHLDRRYKEGAVDERERMNKLTALLAKQGRIDELVRAAENAELQQQLLEEFGLA